MELSKKIKCLRKKMGLSQLELSEKMQVSRQAVSGWESGSSKPSTENLKHLGSLYKVPLEYLLNDDAPDSTYVDLSDGEEINRESKVNRKIIVRVLIGIGIIAIILGALLLGERTVAPNRMNDMKGSEIELEKGFAIDW